MMETAQKSTNNGISARLFTPEDLPVIEGWWAHQRKGSFDPSVLSTIGVVIEGEIPEAVGFLYETNSSRCIFDFCMVNPSLPKKRRGESIEAMIVTLVRLAAKRGFKYVEITVKIPALIRRCEKLGFQALGECKFMARDLCQV